MITSLIQGGGQLILTQVNTTIACFVPACISFVALFVIGRTKMYKDQWRVEDSRIMNREFEEDASSETPQNMSLAQAFFPYAALTIITLVVLLITPIKTFLGQFSFGFAFPETSTSYGFVNEASDSFSPLSPFTHASMFLLISSLVGLLYFRKHGWIKASGCKVVFVHSLQKTMPSSIAVIGFIMMSKIMGGTGQTMVLASGIANVLGTGYAVLAPVIGMLGSFMTSSNMASNILFGEFQITTANFLGLKAAMILGAQTAGGAIGSSICPGNIILGTTTAKILGKEGVVLKKIIPFTLSAAVLVGIILFLTVIFG